MTQDDLYDLLDIVWDVIKALALSAVIALAAGYLYGKLVDSPAKKTVPDCGSCRLYKDKSK
jgi:hypothetical protein